ncbi:MAG: YchJ family protein [Rhodospirillaceae bacterium]
MSICHCGTGRDFDECCGPCLSGAAPAPTAEALMRSRYTAFVTADIDYLENSLLPEVRGDLDRDHISNWAKNSTWLGLEVLSTSGGGVDDDSGMVEFSASFRTGGRELQHHEIGRFTKLDGRWYYKDGDLVKQQPRVVTKIGRNDPCSCGSGKKHKKCCGGAVA